VDLQQYLAEMAAPPGPMADEGSDVYSSSSDEEGYEPDPPPPTPRQMEFRSAATSLGSSPPKRARVTNVEACDGEALKIPTECLICCDRPVRTLFAACGHMAVCTTCSLQCAACPLCRTAVQEGDVIRVFAG
jgi:hypothetical protein